MKLLTLLLLLLTTLSSWAQVSPTGIKVASGEVISFPQEMYCQTPRQEIFQRYLIDSLKHVVAYKDLIILEERAMFRASDQEYKACDSLRRVIQSTHEMQLKELEKTYKDDMSTLYLRADEWAKRTQYHMEASAKWKGRFWKSVAVGGSAVALTLLLGSTF